MKIEPLNKAARLLDVLSEKGFVEDNLHDRECLTAIDSRSGLFLATRTLNYDFKALDGFIINVYVLEGCKKNYIARIFIGKDDFSVESARSRGSICFGYNNADTPIQKLIAHIAEVGGQLR